ncbi:MAG TPA: hypothetical protein VMJ10_02660 [Kofleriaceae bacterium]|nr:hypothetical protein [Kofleriaceae bacterium]
MIKTSLVSAVTLVMLCLFGGMARADHPAYLHALADLRAARAHLQRPSGVVVKWDENRAIREIDAAIREIKTAAIDDGKPLEDHPPIDVGMDWRGRLHRSLELVQGSYDDVNKREDNDFARGLKHRALEHMQNAMQAIRDGISDAEAIRDVPPSAGPAGHPAYLHALSDLRAARAWLQKPSGYAIKWDENQAIREVDGAIREIKAAAIDDGKPLEDHPPIDVPEYGGRLHKVMELLDRSRGDINEHEDNAWARGLKRRALGHIDAAKGFVQAGLDIADAPAQHPAYLHALSDLRLARALLQRPTRNGAVKWDENTAIREIDGAIREIKGAALDDGKPLEDHPPIDAGIEWGGRLQKAFDLVSAARADIDKREDDRFARGMKRRAIKRLDAAILAIKLGQDDAHY